jgi:DnaA family protein
MEQLTLALAAPDPPSFDNYVVGHNAEALAALRALAGGAAGETGLLLWGASGAGKTHLLRATVAAVRSRGAAVMLFEAPGALVAADAEVVGRNALIAVDAVDSASPEAQARLFTLFNVLQAAGGRLLAASQAPLARLPLREDLRTRMGWGQVYEVQPLADADKPAALLAWARQRGFGLADEVIRHLLVHGRRDMTTLLATLEALDRHSLATKRPITVALLRGWLQHEMHLPR